MANINHSVEEYHKTIDIIDGFMLSVHDLVKVSEAASRIKFDEPFEECDHKQFFHWKKKIERRSGAGGMATVHLLNDLYDWLANMASWIELAHESGKHLCLKEVIPGDHESLAKHLKSLLEKVRTGHRAAVNILNQI